MTAKELHYKIWDGICSYLKKLRNDNSKLANWKDSLYYIKMKIIRNMDMSIYEKSLLDEHSSCVLCAMQHGHNAKFLCKNCPIYNSYGYTCSDSQSAYVRCTGNIIYAQDGPVDDRRRYIGKAIEYAERIRDVPLPEEYAIELTKL